MKAAQEGVQMRTKGYRAANWQVWANIPTVNVWEAVSLSLNIEPEALKEMGAFDPVDAHKIHPPEFGDRLFIATRNAEALRSRGLNKETPPPYWMVRLSGFARWAVDTVKWSNLPPELLELSGRDSSLLQRGRRANWDEWRYAPIVKLWEACALSLDIDPNSLRVDLDATAFDGLKQMLYAPDGFSSPKVQEEFNQRRRMAGRCLGNPIKITVARASGDDTAVDLSSFAQWATSIPWELPPDFSEMEKPLVEEREGDSKRRTHSASGTKAREEQWIAKAREMANDIYFSFRDKGKAATKKDVAQEIAGRFKRNATVTVRGRPITWGYVCKMALAEWRLPESD